MNLKERSKLIEVYKNQFNHYQLSDFSEIESVRLKAQKDIMELFFTEKEINEIENNIRVNKQYVKEYFEVIESWIKQINRETGEKEMFFSWDLEGLNKINNHYDWLFNDYKGFKLAITNTFELIGRI